MILGRGWIQKNNANASFSTNRIYIHHGITSLPLLPISRNEPIVMSLPRSIVIPPFHEKYALGYVSIKSLDHALFTYNIALQHVHLVLITYSILHIRNHRGIISITNNTRHLKIISRHTLLGFICSTADENDINIIQKLSANSHQMSSDGLFLFSCAHCDVQFSLEINLYEHLISSCTKNLNWAWNRFNKFVEHIDDPIKRMKVHLMLHQYGNLFRNSSKQRVSCSPQNGINTSSSPSIAKHSRQISPSNTQIISGEVKKMLDNRIISPSNSSWASAAVVVKKVARFSSILC